MECKLCEGECKGTNVQVREIMRIVKVINPDTGPRYPEWMPSFVYDKIVACQESAEYHNEGTDEALSGMNDDHAAIDYWSD